MPNPEQIAACVAAGLDPAQPFTYTTGCWLDTHPSVEIDFITQNGARVAVAYRNYATGRRVSKIAKPGHVPDDGTIDSTFDDIQFLPVNRVKVLQAFMDNFPNVDLSNLVTYRQGNKVVVDLSAYTPVQQASAKAKLLLANFADKLTVLP